MPINPLEPRVEFVLSKNKIENLSQLYKGQLRGQAERPEDATFAVSTNVR